MNFINGIKMNRAVSMVALGILALVVIACFGFMGCSAGEDVNPSETIATEMTPTPPTLVSPTDETVVPQETEELPSNPTEEVVDVPDETEPTGKEDTDDIASSEKPTEPDATEPEGAEQVHYDAVDETVYATTNVNIRSGPGTEHEKLGTLKAGESVRRIGVGDNGWSKVVYNDEEVYINSDYLSTSKPVASHKDNDNSGTSTDNSDTSDDSSSDSTPSDNSGNSGNSSSNSSETSGSGTKVVVQVADPTTGISWDGVSPIIYTYTDGTTGTTPKDGAWYECLPGVYNIYMTYESSMDKENAKDADNGIFYCSHCGRVMGDGANGTCVRWLTGGDHTCSCCGETVHSGTCHSCD